LQVIGQESAFPLFTSFSTGGWLTGFLKHQQNVWFLNWEGHKKIIREDMDDTIESNAAKVWNLFVMANQPTPP